MFLRREHLAALVVAASLAASAQPSYAQWNANGLPVCTAANNQIWPTIVTDGAGGAIVTWLDQRSGDYRGIYAQHLLASGTVDSVWTNANGNADGTPLSVASGKGIPTIVTDGAGGAIVTWADNRNYNIGIYNSDIYAQHVLASGAVDPVWTAANGNADGTPLCTNLFQQGEPTIVTDGAGGAIVTWMDARPTGSYYEIYAQHLLASGAVDPAWPVDGSRVPGGGYTPMIVADGAGGAIVTWSNSYGAGVYAQHLLASGTVDSVWTNANGNANGTPLCTPTAYQAPAMIVTDGAGGAIVTWTDGWAARIYAQRVNAAGVVQWTSDGVALCTAGGQSSPTIVPDGAGGAIVTWQDSRSSNSDIYAQHVLASGTVDPAWPANGLGVCTTAGNQSVPMIVTDGAGGAIVTWADGRPTDATSEIYAQHLLALGAVDPAWPADGRSLCTAVGPQTYPKIATDGLGGAIVAWWDGRNGSINSDIYAQRVSGSGGITAVAPGGPSYSFAMHSPHPNPTHAASTISFELPTARHVAVGVYDVTGRLVRTLTGGGEFPAGTHSLVWNGAGDSGTPARAGIYFIRVSASSAVETRRVAIIP